MRLKRIAKFTSSVTKGLLPSQQATICQVVCALTVCRSLCLAEIARCFETETAFRHNLKRVFRYADNERISQQSSKEVVAGRLINQLRHRLEIKPDQYLEIIIDWTSVNRFQMLSALVPLDGRAVPILQWTVKKWEFRRSQNTFEEQFIQSLRRSIPRHLKVIIVADRGFQRADFLTFVRGLGFSFVIRVKGDAWVEMSGYSGKLRDYKLSVGQTFKESRVVYHKTKRMQMKIVLNCARIEGKVCSWLLATDLGLTAKQIVKIYQRRMWCEESFRDQKQEFKLEKVRVEEARRLENLVLALAIVLMILAVIGQRGKKLGWANKFSVPRKKEVEISWVQIALHLLRKSTEFLNLLFESKGAGFFFRWA